MSDRPTTQAPLMPHEPQWTADIAIDLDLATALVREQFTAFADAIVEPVRVGGITLR